MREYRGGDRGGRDYSHDRSHGASTDAEHAPSKTPEEQAADRVSRFRSNAEQVASHATKLAQIGSYDDWHAEHADIEHRRDRLERESSGREKDASVSETARSEFETARKLLEQVAETLRVAKEPRPKPPVAGELEIEPQIKDRSADANDVLAWGASLSSGQRRALADRLSVAKAGGKSKDSDEFAIELANYLAGASALFTFEKVLADPRRFDRAAYERERAKRAPDEQPASHSPEHAARDAGVAEQHVESVDDTLTRALDAVDLEPALEAAFAALGTTERLALADRLERYRPGMSGDFVAARIKRLDRTPRLVQVLASLRNPTSRLPDEVRSDLEQATGRSLDHVRVHAGADGHAVAESHGARAVAIGSDIYMGAGQLDPVSGEGRELIAHEVAHTVQAEAHPGPVAAAAKRDGESTEAAEREADAFGASFRSEGAAANWSPSVPVASATPLRAPVTARSVDPAHAREGFNAKLDNQLSIAARQDANIAAPGYLHLHMAEVRRGAHLFLASRNTPSGDAQVELRDGFFDALFQAFDGNDTAASVTRLRNWIAPSDLYAIVDRNRPIIELEKAQSTHPNAALDYQHGPKGPAHWSPAVATAIGSALEPRLIESLARMSPRLVAVTARKREAAKTTGEAPAPVRPAELVCAHPLDWHVALAMVGRAARGVDVKPGALAVSAEAQVTYRKISAVEWQGGHGGAWNALRVVTPDNANVEEVAYYIFGRSTEAYRIQRVGSYFLIPEDEAGRIPAAAVFRGIAGVGTEAMAFGASASAVETAEVERAIARDRENGHAQPATAATSATALHVQWQRIQEQLQGLAIVVRPYGLAAALNGAIGRHHAHKADLAMLSPHDAGIRGELFARQALLLTKIAAEIGSVASQADEQHARAAKVAAVAKAGGANPHGSADASTTTALQRLVHAANLSHLPETGEAALADAHVASRGTISDTLEAMLGQAATQIEIARLTMSHSHASSARSTRVFGASFQQRADALRQRLAELRSNLLHGAADPSEIQTLHAAIDGLRVETGMVAQIGQLGQLFDVLDQLESSNWVLFSEALTAKIGDTSEDNHIGRLETARRGAFELRSDLQTLHSKWLTVQQGASELAGELEAGGASNAKDQAATSVLPQLDAIRQKLAKIGGNAEVQTFLREAYDKVDSAQTRAMIVQIATMIGIAVVSGGVASMAEGVALGAGASAFGAQLAGLGVETTTFTLLSARLSGESIVHAFASNFAGNLVTFGAIRATNALVAGSAIGKTLAQAKGGARISRLAAIAAKTAEISAPMLVAIGVQFAQAEAEMLLREGRTLTMDELTATGVQGIAMMIGAAVSHKVLGESMNEAKAFGADFAARKAQRAHLEKLAHDVMAHGDGSQALDLMREARVYVEAEVAKWQELNKLPVNELESRGLSKPVVDAMTKSAQAHVGALDAMESGTIAAQLGLDTVVPGHVYAGDAHAVQRVLDGYRGRGYRVDAESGGFRVSRHDDPTVLRILERQTVGEPSHGHGDTQGPRQQDVGKGHEGQRSQIILAGDDARLREVAPHIKPLEGWLDVITHGNVDEFEVLVGGNIVMLDHRALARWIGKSGGARKRIRLLSCETGKHAKGAAQHLANKLGVEVMAPTDYLHVFPDGSMVIGPTDTRNTGSWKVFKPQQSQRRFSQPTERAPERAIDRLKRMRQEREAARHESTTLGDHDHGDAHAASRTPLDEHTDLLSAAEVGKDHAERVSAQFAGPLSEKVKDVDLLSQSSDLQVEAGLRVLDPLFGKPTSAEFKRAAKAIDAEQDHTRREASRSQFLDLDDHRDRISKQMLDIMRDPSIDISARKSALHGLVDEFENALHAYGAVDVSKIGLATARRNIDALHGETFENMLSVDAAGNLRRNGKPAGTIRDLMRDVQQTNAAFRDSGIPEEFVISVSSPRDPSVPREVKILTRTPKLVEPPAKKPGSPVEPSEPSQEGLVVDVGVGLGDYARDVGGETGTVVKTEYGEGYADPAMIRRDLTWQHTAPRVDVDSVVVIGDALQTLPMLFGERSIKRIFINNINAHYAEGSGEYLTLARGLRQVMAPGGRVEVQWTTALETTGGVTGPRGHITGEGLAAALEATALDAPRGVSIDKNATPVTDYEYSVEAPRTKTGIPSKTPPSNPVPTRRWVITFGA